MVWVRWRLHLSLVSIHGGDDTGQFAGKGKLTFLKVLEELDSDNDKVHALSQLVEEEQLSEATINVIESFVCQIYLPRTELTYVADASSWLFKKKRAQSEGFPHKSFIPSSFIMSLLPGNELVQWRHSKSRVTTTCWLRLEFSWLQIQTSDDIFASCSWCSYSFGEVWLFKVNNVCMISKNKLKCTEFCWCSIKSDECKYAECENSIPLLRDDEDKDNSEH